MVPHLPSRPCIASETRLGNDSRASDRWVTSPAIAFFQKSCSCRQQRNVFNRTYATHPALIFLLQPGQNPACAARAALPCQGLSPRLPPAPRRPRPLAITDEELIIPTASGARADAKAARRGKAARANYRCGRGHRPRLQRALVTPVVELAGGTRAAEGAGLVAGFVSVELLAQIFRRVVHERL